ncbi:sugar ABC transporter ATP-binding protein [Kurthia sibirica]|uniref:D-xylose ABC transporter ATP-binding protein n=1 Tax=Kurthia sibirica TaxID=202750 RepID=A0A2U3AK00_9BACL|nr:sugar ABC transporter ATP-binding protein [Kurthia sibirica]PWI24862.1 D-xylose ABC transporter ATP-binding protein [Kurthia sibirica]GEK35206.1 monosaccharide-transporting ATPase [Kurthia sibirica]
MNKLLEMHNISKSFPGVKALSDVSLDLNHGEVLALVGENGAGKSTLMKILTGIYSKDDGEILYEGKPLQLTSPKEAQEMGISIIHQELNLMKDLTIAENIFIGREPRGMFNFFIKDRKLNDMTNELFEKLALKLDSKTKVQNLTVAKQQMVEIAKALSFDSKILIMDEPTTALTDSEIDVLFAIIEQLKEKGVGIIYISHRMDELKRISDRVLIMRDGQYVDTLETKTTEISTVINKMVGREIFIESKPEKFDDNEQIVLELKNVETMKQLKNISFQLKKGEILGFAGLMGAGRTEVANAIFGVDRLKKGEIHLNGKKVTIKSPAKAVQKGIGYLSEDRKHLGLLTDLDVKTNIIMSNIEKIQNFGFINENTSKEIAEKYVKQLKIKTPNVNQKIKFLSGGNQQKIVIAKWLLKDCDILIFDEPTRGIDVGAKGEIYKLLDELAESGKSIIMISSELPEILRMSHRIVVMSEGKITGILKSEEASQEKIMELATAYQA